MDLNLIRVFVAVHEEGSVTAAAERLHLSQPTVTQALNRLRRETGEELFIRVGRGIEPTRSATELYAKVGHIPGAVDAAVRAVSHFDPATTVETFRMALTDLGQTIFLPTLVPALTREAPHATLEVLNLDVDSASEDLAAGRIDLAVASTVLPGKLRSSVVRPDLYCCVARKGRFGSGSPTFEQLSQLPRVVARNTLGHTLVESLLPEPVEGSVYLPAFSAIPAIVSASDLIAFVPHAIIGAWSSLWDIETWPLPQGTFTALIRAHTASHPTSAANAWFTQWATTRMQRTA
ncbi:LysR family transcriptional regulator [Nesterenkonia sp. E16_7]|uniref:LysR family transcriptional regulator n=1 Tax=unclassified Nesterenkonia TaxID=2629769 RepID=UPI001A917033|nr:MULTISPECIES: LysR family transcriptional regulator [unclassified Nesterenkonia]MBO0594954.1 LysR family transcriptional regulator [Nesterenkonia sp. E16_10]MBO0598609.1 LysR family transcriptional regulator [Nesterenkonia sp. E16_7]